MSNIVATKNAGAWLTGEPATASLYAATGERKYVNKAERRRLIQATSEHDAQRALFGLVLAWTGARVSEVLALTPSSFQLDTSVVAFVTLKRRKHHVREIPIPASLMQALTKGFDLETALLDPKRAHARLWPWHRVTAWRFVKQLMTQAGVTGRAASPRGLRHGFGVGAIQSGVPLNLLKRWLGHSRLSSTAIYADACGPEERALASRFWEQAN